MKVTSKLLLLIYMSLSLSACKDELGVSNIGEQDAESYSVDLALESVDKASEDFADAGLSQEVVSTELPIDDLEENDFISEVDREDEYSQDRSFRFCKPPARRRTCRSNDIESAKLAIYENCIFPGTRVKALGYVRLSYNSTRCSLVESGNLVNRTYRLSLSRRRGGNISFSSVQHKNYAGALLGGGETLERTDNGWALSIQGRHIRQHKKNGKIRGDISVKTLKPLIIENSLERKSRVIVSGVTEVAHNLAKFTATYAVKNLVFTADCACPVSGAMEVTYSGSKEGTGTIEFSQCGKAQFQKQKIKKWLRLRQCFNSYAD